ncbi:MAG TPA: hypothetical protein VEZ90_14665 [Blastocatellia bacterium]|nr:hypothetical protein [Blastocatellia bacterium]
MQFRKTITLAAAFLLMTATAWAQDKSADKGGASDPVSGSYKGTAKSDAFGELPITVQIKNDGGKLTGTIGTPQGDAQITDGKYEGGKVSIKFDAGGNEGTVTAQVKDGKIVGEWSVAGANGTLELAKATETAEPKPAEAKPAPSSSSSSSGGGAAMAVAGDWDASANADGNEFPFTLTLKVDGDKVSGESTSAMGTATISKGSIAGNKLSITLDTPNGSITMTGTVGDGKLEGDFDFAGQMQGKWHATKKK